MTAKEVYDCKLKACSLNTESLKSSLSNIENGINDRELIINNDSISILDNAIEQWIGPLQFPARLVYNILPLLNGKSMIRI